MKLTVFLLFFYVACVAQPTQRCPVCPASLKGVTNGWVLTDSSVIVAQDGTNPKSATLQTDTSDLIQALHDTMQAKANLMPH